MNKLNDVNFFMKILMDKINELLPNVEYSNKDYFWNPECNLASTHIETIKVGQILLENMFTFKKIYVTIFDFNSKEELSTLFHRFSDTSTYDQVNSILRLVFPAVNGKLYTPYVKQVISHELLHMLKSMFGANSTASLYQNALNIIDNHNISDNNINKKIAWEIYLLDNQEIDANCQGGYNDGIQKKITNIDDIKSKSQLYSDSLYIKDNLKTINELSDDDKMYDETLFSNCKLRNIKKYLNLQYKHFKYKVDRIFNKIIIDNSKTIEEGFRKNNPLKIKIL